MTTPIISYHFWTLEHVFHMLQQSRKHFWQQHKSLLRRVDFGDLSKHFPG